MSEKRIQVRGEEADHTCWEGNPDEFQALGAFTCEECAAKFIPGDDAGSTYLFVYERVTAPPTTEDPRKLHSRDDYHDDYGPVLWWKLPIVEPPYAGTPLDDDFPEYSTHWTVILLPERLV